MVEKRGWSRAAEVYAAGLFLAYAAMIFAHKGGPSLTDYANWTYQGELLRAHLLGLSDKTHEMKAYPVPNSLTTVGIGLLALALPWLLAAKVWLTVQLALCFAAMRYLLRTISAPFVAWIVVPQAVFLNVNFWYGFMNFELGLAWVMVFAALLLRRLHGERIPAWVVAAMLVLVFFTHMIPFCFCVLLLALYGWQTGRLREVWAAAPSFLLTIWYVLGRFLLAGNADGQAGMQETVRNYSAAFWVFKANSYAKSFGFVNPLGFDQLVFGRWGFYALLLAEGCLAASVAWGLLRVASRALRGRARDQSGRQFLWLGLGLMAPVYLLAPGAALGISDPGARVLQTGLAVGLALCWPGMRRSLHVVAGSCAVLLAGGGLMMFLAYGGELGGGLHLDMPGTAARAAQFGRVPNVDQDYFYGALNRGDMRLTVFPTGMLLNEGAEAPPGGR